MRHKLFHRAPTEPEERLPAVEGNVNRAERFGWLARTAFVFCEEVRLSGCIWV